MPYSSRWPLRHLLAGLPPVPLPRGYLSAALVVWFKYGCIGCGMVALDSSTGPISHLDSAHGRGVKVLPLVHSTRCGWSKPGTAHHGNAELLTPVTRERSTEVSCLFGYLVGVCGALVACFSVVIVAVLLLSKLCSRWRPVMPPPPFRHVLRGKLAGRYALLCLLANSVCHRKQLLSTRSV
jgi:hypothetical protein